ncbi:hypothetical protein CBR_g50217 [Chara braunii]|uniref:Uncharacterized protein n=1 Tax=Chara braunii TaxID=69332 RepID=A0A388M6B3_CHABU|nr:hypothetical protein CBR_g50217 [Chara braunii]|eukprot:GBG90124.1 hypothetical protein CBR_g50217 [Chara braunii]
MVRPTRGAFRMELRSEETEPVDQDQEVTETESTGEGRSTHLGVIRDGLTTCKRRRRRGKKGGKKRRKGRRRRRRAAQPDA